ncbi:MAG: hypothetical protein WD226_02545 [Planctomycetota bacterium]
MQWTTGDASNGVGGVGGFGGIPATVGANKGDGVNYFQIGRFDQPGVAYDGPDGASDGVDFLDFSDFCFSTLGDTNVPPIALGVPAGSRYDTYVGVPFPFSIDFIGPEGGQTVSVVVTDGGLANFSAITTPGNPANVSGTFTPDASQDGMSFPVTLVATDDGIPPLSTTVNLSFNVSCAAATNTVRPGSDNAQTYASSTPPVFLDTWIGTVTDPDCTLVFWAVAPAFLGGSLDPGVDAGSFATGDFLINPAAIWTPIFISMNPFVPDAATGVVTISFTIPDLLYHCSETWSTQCLCVQTDGSFILTNALDVVLGL